MARSHDQDKLDRQLAAMRDGVRAGGRGMRSDGRVHRRGDLPDLPDRRGRTALPGGGHAIRSLGLEVSPRKSGGGTDGNYFNAKGIPCVALPTGMVDEHATSEHIAIDDMVLACQTLVAIVTQPARGRWTSHETSHRAKVCRGGRRCHEPRRGGLWQHPAAQDLCANAKNLTAAVTRCSALKPDGAKLDELSAKVDAALAKLDRLQAVTEGRYDTAISTLRANLDPFKEAVAAAGNDAFDAAAPQLTASLDELRSAYASLNQSLATQCPSG